MHVRRFHAEGLWIEAALAELQAAGAAARAAGRASLALCLAGGSTPERVYAAIAALPWPGPSLELWPGDERAVPAGEPGRNGLMIARAFAGCPARLHPWPETATEAEADAACVRYQEELIASLGPVPAFDLAFLGLGADGHTASLFPGFAPEAGEGRLAFPSRSPLPPFSRMTLGPSVLAASRRRVFLVRGADKLPALRRLEAEDPSIPASLLAGPASVALYLE